MKHLKVQRAEELRKRGGAVECERIVKSVVSLRTVLRAGAPH